MSDHHILHAEFVSMLVGRTRKMQIGLADLEIASGYFHIVFKKDGVTDSRWLPVETTSMRILNACLDEIHTK